MKLVDFLMCCACEKIVIRNAGDRVFSGPIDDVPNAFLSRDVLWFDVQTTFHSGSGNLRVDSYLLVTLK